MKNRSEGFGSCGPSISFVVPVYNEEDRIGAVLAHSTCWADEVIVINKSSTDRTVERVLEFDSPKVKIKTIPFSAQGHDNINLWLSEAIHSWVFIGTCSEIPTSKLIGKIRNLLSERASRCDLIKVPRRMYSLGIHHPNSPWSVSYYPFLFHKERVIICPDVHVHFKAKNSARVQTIPYSKDCCVYHLTHKSVDDFIKVHAEYAKLEALKTGDPDAAILKNLENIYTKLPNILRTGDDWAGICSTWTIYCMMNILEIWEKNRDGDALVVYDELRTELLEREWDVKLFSDFEYSSERSINIISPNEEVVNELSKAVFIAYKFAQILYLIKHPKKIPIAVQKWLGYRFNRFVSLISLRSNL